MGFTKDTANRGNSGVPVVLRLENTVFFRINDHASEFNDGKDFPI